MPVLGVREIERGLKDLKLSNSAPQNRSQYAQQGQGHHDDRRGSRARTQRSSSRNSRPRSGSGFRRRSSSMTSNASVGSRRGRFNSRGSAPNNLPSIEGIQDQLRNRYDRNVMNLVHRYIKDSESNAEVVNNFNYLRHCRRLGLIPREYWTSNNGIRNTRDIVRLLDDCSSRLMYSDMEYYGRRRNQLSGSLGRLEDELEKALTFKEFHNLCAATKYHRNDLFEKIREEQRKAVDVLRQEVLDYQKYLDERRKSMKKPRQKRSSSRNGSSGMKTGGRMRSDARPSSEKNQYGGGASGDESAEAEDEQRDPSHRANRRRVARAGSLSSRGSSEED